MLLQKVTSAKSFVVPECLPPTESATRFHSYRSYYQIMVWQVLDQGIHATDCVWILGDNNKLVPVMTDMSPAPERLLKVIHINCKTGFVSARCNCKRNDWVCSPACGPCQNDGCSNTQLVANIDNSGESDDENNFCE